jgi:putative solute:sodium symporter small subunit
MFVEPAARDAASQRFWRRHGRLVAVLTVVWILASFVVPILAGWTRDPAVGMSPALWVAAEALPLVFLGIVWVYARRADGLDAEYGAARH